MIIPTLIINWAGQWLGQGGFSITGQTNIECDICPGLMSRILCFCNRIHIVHIEKQAGVNIGKQLLADTFPPRLSTMWTQRTIDQVHWQMHYRQIPYHGHAKAHKTYFSVLLCVGGID